MRAAIEWSHDLLNDDEQALLRRLSVFPGGFTVVSAESVAGGHVDEIQALLEKSLLRRNSGAQEPRFSMLETIREFASERLALANEVDEYRRRHMEHYVGVADECFDETMREQDDLVRLDLERENLRLALDVALETNPDVALDLAPKLFLSWVRRGDLHEGRARLAVALSQAPEPTGIGARTSAARCGATGVLAG